MLTGEHEDYLLLFIFLFKLVTESINLIVKCLQSSSQQAIFL